MNNANDINTTLSRVLKSKHSIANKVLAYLSEQGTMTVEQCFSATFGFHTKVHRSRQSVHNALYRLKQYGFLKTKKENGIWVYYLPENVKKELKAFEGLGLRESDPAKWDGRWRLVSFDIPEVQKKHRDTLRRKLKSLGLGLFQHSVWVSPYPLENSFYRIIHEAGVGDCVKIIDSDKIPEPKKWIKHFNLDYSHAARPRAR